jgi:hypothetical protein
MIGEEEEKAVKCEHMGGIFYIFEESIEMTER